MIDILTGDCREILPTLAADSIDACVTDPPYELGFMGKGWDRSGIANDPAMWAAVLRVMKPGAHLLAFGGTRTHHRMMCAVEDAGFEIRDVIMWVYGSGFPKSLDVSKALDSRKDWAALRELQGKVKAARGALGIPQSEAARRMGLIGADEQLGGGGFMWFETGMRLPTAEQYQALKAALALDDACDEAFQAAEREVVGQHRATAAGQNMRVGIGGQGEPLPPGDITAPATDAAKQWQGWGTALKPAYEPIIVARKPLSGTVAANVLRYGTGAINVDACRVRFASDEDKAAAAAAAAAQRAGQPEHGGGQGVSCRLGFTNGPASIAPYLARMDAGRWPANLIHDGSEEVVALFPDEAGAAAPVRRRNADKFRSTFGAFSGDIDEAGSTFHGDTGSAARFFASFPQEGIWDQSNANTAPQNLSLQSVLAASVASGAATWPSLAGIVSSDSTERFTSVTENESSALCECVITAMAPIGSGFLRESRHERRTLSGSLVSVVAQADPTGTTTITASLLKSDGSAGSVTSRITPSSLDLGALASRFRYCAKADREDRESGCDDLPPRSAGDATGGRKEGSAGLDNPRAGASRTNGARNHHPTVKPHDLMRYLCRLVTPPGGLILDPFAGSGSTAKAALAEGFRCVSIERDPEYAEIIRRRARGQAGLAL